MAKVEKTIEIDVPVSTAYNQWTQFEEYPNFMEGVEEVKQMDDSHLHWRVKVAGKEKEWDAEITEQRPDEVIAWRSVDGTQNSGVIRFQPMGANKTRLTCLVEYDPEGFVENVGDIVGVTSRRIENDLQRFKEFVESRGGETGAWRGEVHEGKATGTSKRSGSGSRATASGQMQSEQRRTGQQASGSASSVNVQQGSGARGMRSGQTSGSSGYPERGGEGRSKLPSFFGGWEDPFTSVRRMADEMERCSKTLPVDRFVHSAVSAVSLQAHGCPRLKSRSKAID